MSARTGRLLWASSAAGSLAIHAGFALAALALVPWPKPASPKPDTAISVADVTTGFAESAAPVAEVPLPVAASEAAAVKPVESVTAKPVEAPAPLQAVVAEAVPVAKPVAQTAIQPVVAAAVPPVATARPVETAAMQPIAGAARPAPVTSAVAQSVEAAGDVPAVQAVGVAAPVTGMAAASVAAAQTAGGVESATAANVPPLPQAVAITDAALPAATAADVAAGMVSLPVSSVAAPVVSGVVVATGGVAQGALPNGGATAVASGPVAVAPTVQGVVAAPVSAAGVGVAGVPAPVQVGVATAVPAGAAAVAAPQQQVLVAAVPETASVVALPEAEQVPQASAVLPGLAEMSAFIDTVSDQTCLAAVAENDASGIPAMTGYGSTAALDTFTSEARARFGPELPIDTRAISSGQCWLLDMLGAWRRYWDPNFDIALISDQVASGGTVRGSISNYSGTWLYVLLVDDDGKVSDLGDYLTQNGKTVTLAAPVTATGSGQQRLQLLVAITAETSLISVDQHRGEAAQSFFAALQQELKTRQIRPQLSVTAFNVY